MNWIIWGIVAWLACGVITTIILSQTPYADNPWWLTTVLGPITFILLALGN